MNFGDILDDWEKQRSQKSPVKPVQSVINNTPQSGGDYSRPMQKANPMDVWLRRYGVEDKDSLVEESSPDPAARRRALREMESEAILDLHGCTQEEAENRLQVFFSDSVRNGLQKVLIIHGKGSHSEQAPVLQRVVQRFLERNPYAGESGFSTRKNGGTGSTWVLLKGIHKN